MISGGGGRWRTLKPSDVEGLIAAKRAQGLAGSTIGTIYTVLRAAVDVALRDGLVQRNVTAVVKRPLADSREAAYLTGEQASGLLRAIEGERLAPLIRLLLSTGLPRGEALALR